MMEPWAAIVVSGVSCAMAFFLLGVVYEHRRIVNKLADVAFPPEDTRSHRQRLASVKAWFRRERGWRAALRRQREEM